MRPRKRKNQVTRGKEMTMKIDHAADGITADHPPGLGAVAVHRLPGMSQETSLRRERVMSRERSQVMERRGDDLVAGAVQGTVHNHCGVHYSLLLFFMLLSSIAYVLYFVPDLSREWFKLHQSSKKSKVTLLYYFDLLLVVCIRGHRSSFRIVIERFYSKLSEVIIMVIVNP